MVTHSGVVCSSLNFAISGVNCLCVVISSLGSDLANVRSKN